MFSNKNYLRQESNEMSLIIFYLGKNGETKKSQEIEIKFQLTRNKTGRPDRQTPYGERNNTEAGRSDGESNNKKTKYNSRLI